MRGPEVAARFAAAFCCALDFYVDVDFDFCSRSEQLSDGVAATPLNVARERLDMGARAPGNLARKRLENGALAPGKA